MKRNLVTKIAAILALAWILIWVLSTWLMVIFQTWGITQPKQQAQTQEYTKEQIEELIKSLSGSTLSGSTSTWVEVATGAKK